MGLPETWDAALSAIRSSADDLGVSLAIWQARREPDAQARRAANDAMDAVDRALAELHALRSRLLGEVRASDDRAAARVDELLGTGLAPPGQESSSGPDNASPDRHQETPPSPKREADSKPSARDRHEVALKVGCSYCDAERGSACRTRRGSSLGARYHARRYTMAVFIFGPAEGDDDPWRAAARVTP